MRLTFQADAQNRAPRDNEKPDELRPRALPMKLKPNSPKKRRLKLVPTNALAATVVLRSLVVAELAPVALRIRVVAAPMPAPK